MIEARGRSDGVEQIVGNKTDVKLEAVGLGNEDVATLGDDQCANAGGYEIAR